MEGSFNTHMIMIGIVLRILDGRTQESWLPNIMTKTLTRVPEPSRDKFRVEFQSPSNYSDEGWSSGHKAVDRICRCLGIVGFRNVITESVMDICRGGLHNLHSTQLRA